MELREAPNIARRIVAERGVAPLAMSVMVLGWSTKSLVELALTHTTGAEIYGVATAAVAVVGGLVNIGLFAKGERRSWLIAGAIAIWVVVALAGIVGAVAHVIGPVAGHGPVDLRPRPIAAPLIFTALGTIGGFALFLGHRAANHRIRESEKE